MSDHVRTPARVPVIAVLAGLLVAAALVDRGTGPPRVAAGPAVLPMPAAAPASALSSTWFCAGPVDQPAGVGSGTLVLVNSTGEGRHASVILTGARGPADTRTVVVGPYARVAVSEVATASLPFTGAVVEVDGGGVAVEQVVAGSLGPSVTACSTAGSDRWYFAEGTTQENASLLLSLLNPYPEDAIVDLSFLTELGSEAPGEFQGIVVPARSLVGIDVGSHLRRRVQVATTVSARTGRVVAWRTQVVTAPPNVDSSGAPVSPPAPGQQRSAPTAAPRVPGVSVALGASSAGTSWWWPEGVVSDGVTERYRIFNPGSTEAALSLALILDQGSAEPFQLKVGPHSTTTLNAGAESRIQSGVGHAAFLRSTNGVGVVAERTVDAASPSPRSGLLDVAGARVPARRWVFGGGGTGPDEEEWVVVFNPGTAPTNLSVAALTGAGVTDLPGLAGLTVAAGHRLAVRINDHAPTLDQSLLVEARGDVLVERDLYPAQGPGLAAAMGVPLNA